MIKLFIKDRKILYDIGSTPKIHTMLGSFLTKLFVDVEIDQDKTCDFLLVRSYGRENALARVQSDPLISGLKILGYSAEKAEINSNEKLVIPKIRFLIVSYEDRISLLYARLIKKIIGCKVICLGSDIYKIDHYEKISELVDYFVMPTDLHTEIISSAVWRPVFTVHEAIDDIALPKNGIEKPTSSNGDLCWFGYAESFEKSLKFLFDRSLLLSQIDHSRIKFITSNNAVLHKNIIHENFDLETFYDQSSNFSYSLLSHFAFDCNINSYIKSPNKLVTSIVRGMIPIASKTPNYMKILNHYDMGELSFSNGHKLVSIFKNLDVERDRGIYKMNAVADDLRSRFSEENIAKSLVDQI
jgi:uncharacterized protein YbcI